MYKHETITYIELPSGNLSATKNFFQTVFNWKFQDFGEDYTAFQEETLEGGFFKSDLKSSTQNGAAIIIFYSKDLEDTQKKVEKAGGTVIRPVFSFPGGRRFHFTEPGGNEFAVWSDRE